MRIFLRYFGTRRKIDQIKGIYWNSSYFLICLLYKYVYVCKVSFVIYTVSMYVHIYIFKFHIYALHINNKYKSSFAEKTKASSKS